MKINKIRLYKNTLIEEDGEYELQVSDIEEVPCVITNKALQICKQLGLTETSLAKDVMVMSLSTETNDKGEVVAMDVVEDDRILKAIYAGYVGGQLLLGKSAPAYSYDEFLDRYQDDAIARFTLYQELVISHDNQFIQEIVKSTKKVPGKGEKKLDP